MNKQDLIEKAVLKFNGEWPTNEFEFVDLQKWQEAIIYCIRPDKEASVDPGEIHCGGTGFDSTYYELICTREEFNAAADRMRGKPDWSELPAKAEWLAQDRCGKWKPMQGRKPTIEEDRYWITNRHLQPQPRGTVIGDWRNTLEKRPEQSKPLEADRFGIMPPVNKNEGCSMSAPVKPWFEAGDLPPVGSTEIDCKIKGKAYEQIKAFKVLAHENGKAVIASYHNEREHWAEIESYHKRPVNFTPYVISKPYFLPIEPIKTGKEKVIEAADAVIRKTSSAVDDVALNALYDAGLLRLPDQK